MHADRTTLTIDKTVAKYESLVAAKTKAIKAAEKLENMSLDEIKVTLAKTKTSYEKAKQECDGLRRMHSVSANSPVHRLKTGICDFAGLRPSIRDPS